MKIQACNGLSGTFPGSLKLSNIPRAWLLQDVTQPWLRLLLRTLTMSQRLPSVFADTKMNAFNQYFHTLRRARRDSGFLWPPEVAKQSVLPI